MPKYCSECGKELNDNSNFCPGCGIEIKKEQYNKENKGRTYSILGIVFAFCSLIVFPIGFGPAAVICGSIGVIKGDRTLGITAIVLGVVLAVLSWLLAMYMITKSGFKF